MAKKILGENVPPKCEYCAYSVPGQEEDALQCPKKGKVQPDDLCKKFSYDPLKRTPPRPKPLQTFSAEDFEL